MLIICVQLKSDKFFTSKTKTCQKHINLKKEREQRHTVFLSEAGQRLAETLFFDEDEKEERL